jgi:predicted membrane protein
MSEKKEKKQLSGEKLEFKKIFNYAAIVKNIPFIFYLALLAILYIYNGHYADKLTRKISEGEKNVRELEYEYKTIKSEVIFRSKASELLKVVEPLGLKEVKEPPMVLNDTLQSKP